MVNAALNQERLAIGDGIVRVVRIWTSDGCCGRQNGCACTRRALRRCRQLRTEDTSVIDRDAQCRLEIASIASKTDIHALRILCTRVDAALEAIDIHNGQIAALVIDAALDGEILAV